jgi:NADPH:quinone reductase-like Zn-dependent oxidoreductase
MGSIVYGLTSFFRDGAAAEYIATAAEGLALKPQSLDAIGAAAVPLAALTAWQALFDHGDLRPGQRILIHGAAGGVGAFAVQMAVWKGAHVTGTAGAASLDFIRRLGGEEAIDYRLWPAGEENAAYDMVLDNIGGTTRDRSWSLIKPGGILVSVAEEGEFLQKPLPVPDVRGDWFIVKPNRDQLREIGSLIDAGKIQSVVGDRFPLQAARLAYEKLLQPGRQGKIVLYLQ